MKAKRKSCRNTPSHDDLRDSMDALEICRFATTQKLTAKFVYSLAFLGQIFLGGILMSQQTAMAKEVPGFTYGSPSFTPDSQKLVFDRCSSAHECRIHVLNLNTNELTYYRPPAGQMWFSGKFSPNGKQIAFVAVPLLAKDSGYGDRDWANAQIALMDTDGRNVRMLTRGPGYKQSPNFSWSGKKVIYVQGELRKPGSKTLDADNDAFEIDLETGAIRQLTDYKFFQMGRPSYLPDDISFVVYGDFPANIRGISSTEKMAYLRDLERKNQRSWVHRFETTQKNEVLTTLFTAPFYWAMRVTVDIAGNIYFEAQPNERGRMRVFRHRPDEQLESWAIKPHLQPRAAEISPDGRLWVEVSRPAVEGDLNGIFMLNLTDGDWQEIPASGPAQAINQ